MVDNMDKDKLDKIVTFEEAINKYDSNEMTIDELSTIIQKFGVNVDFWKWNMAVEPNPQYPDGNEESRDFFKWSTYHSGKGRFYQMVTKKVILSSINIAHKYTLERYYKDQFVYDDPRLKDINGWTKKYIKENFQENKDYKMDFMNKIVDIILGTICKEDIYYRARFFDMVNEFIKKHPNGIELTKIEKENIDRWH